MSVDWLLLLWGWLGAAGFMLALWALQLRTGNAGIVDVGWATALGALGVFYALASNGGVEHRVLAGVTAGFWGLRLAWHLLVDRILGRPEEGRYVTLRTNWSPHEQRFFLVFFQAQALLAAILSLPFLLTASRTQSGLQITEWVGAGLWLVGLVGESIADRQLSAFKAQADSRGRVCNVGLWRYSRHPNYFFEWVIWLGFALCATSGLIGLLAWTGPALILFFILRVTGIPPTEAQSLKSRGDAYREYQRTTSPFFPWFPKEGND